MSDVISSHILVGPVRLFLLLSALYFVYAKTYGGEINKIVGLSRVDFFVLVVAIALIVVFALVQLNLYGPFALLLILVSLGLLGSKGLKRKGLYLVPSKEFISNSLSNYRKFSNGIKPDRILQKLISFKSQIQLEKASYMVIFAAVLVLTRVFFLKNDTYTFSNYWIDTLEYVKMISANKWYQTQNFSIGEYALMNLYSNLVGISKEMSIFSFGIVENLMLLVVMNRIILRFGGKSRWPSLITCFSFLVLLSFLPFNLNTIFQHSRVYLAMAFALTFFGLSDIEYTPGAKKLFGILFVLLLATGLTDFFVFLIAIPLLLIPMVIVFGYRKSILHLKAYAFTALLFMLVNSSICLFKGWELRGFFFNNLLALENYTYMEHLAYPLDKLLLGYKIMGWATLFLAFLNYKKQDGHSSLALVFSLHFLLFIHLDSIEISWIDQDTFFHILTFLVPLMIGNFIVAFLFLTKQNFSFYLTKRPLKIAPLLLCAFLGACIFLTQNLSQSIVEGSLLKKDLLKVYDLFATKQLKGTYAVVNSEYGAKLSGGEHFFVGYGLFANNYLKQDSLYQTIKGNPKLERESPDLILPESVFVVLPNKETPIKEMDSHLYTTEKLHLRVENALDSLIARKRMIRTYFKSTNLEVFEIVNKQNRSNLASMIYEYEKIR